MEKHIKQHIRKGLPGGPNELNKFTEAFIISSNGQYDYPGQNTLIPNADGRITMKDVDYPVYGIDDEGNSQMMYPEEEYQFPGNSVYEIPMKKGGLVRMPKVEFTKKGKKKNSKAFSRSLQATNRLFTENTLFKKPKSRKRKVFDPKADYQEGGSLIQAEYGMPMGTGMSQNYQGRKKSLYPDGGAPIPKGYQVALSQFVNPVVNETDENTGYNAATGEVNRDTRPGSIQNNDWWIEHEKFHHLQNLAGGLNTAGAVGQRPNNTVASDESMQGYYNRRDSDLNDHINSMIKANPELQFMPREKLLQSQFPVEGEQPSFLGAEDSIYQDPSTVEGEARMYEQYIEQGGKSVFPEKKKGGALLTKEVTCKKCSWEWDAADGDDDITTCHKCGGQGLIHAQGGGDISIPTLNQYPDGGVIETELTEEEIKEYRRGGWIVENM